MSNLEIYNQRFAESGQRVFARALNGARSRGQNYVVVEHLIEALSAEEGRFFQLLAGLLKIDPGQIQTLMAKRLEIFPQKAGGNLRLAPATIALIKQAWEATRNDHRSKIESLDLIYALARDERGLLIEMLKGLNVDVEDATRTIHALDNCARILSLRLDNKKAESAIRISRSGPELIFIRKDTPRPQPPRLVKRRDK